MPLVIGTRVGHYQILAKVGAGGMGEVYRGRDLNLNREVALKIIPEKFATDPDRLARFTREAQTLAALNHPHIAQVFGLEEADGVRALAMELVEGEDLAQRLARTKVPLQEALGIARQIAEALEAAHEKGIIHRDLKPANIMVDPEGSVKVLDFGLAKIAESHGPDAVADSGLLNSPTMMSPAHTQSGIILGTAAYMSPEQAIGRPADKRCDVWAFGCVLFELLAGKRAFQQPDIHTTLASVLAQHPDWSALDAATPEIVRKLLRRTLEKDRKRRLADIGAARLDLEDALSDTAAPGAAASRAGAPVTAPFRSALPWLVAAAAVTLAVAAYLMIGANGAWGRPIQRSPLTRITAELGAPVALVTSQGPGAVLSPDGTMLAFIGLPDGVGVLQQLFLRRLSDLEATPILSTEGAMNAFFSPDARWIGFFAGGKLKKVAVSGGAPVTLADAPNGRGGSWGEDDHIVYMPDFYAGLWRVSSAGGAPERITKVDGVTETHRWPQVLPGGKAVLYTSHNRLVGYEHANLVVQPLPTGEPKIVQREGYYGRYLASGHLVYLHEGSIFAAPFDLGRLERTGDPTPVIHDVAGGAIWTGGAQFDVANNGTAVYIPGSQSAAPIHWADATSTITPLHLTPTNWSDPSFSPDGSRLAVGVSDGKQADIWVYNVAGDDPPSRLTITAGDDIKPVWSPDGTRLAFAVYGAGLTGFNTHIMRADGTGTPQIVTNARQQMPGSWHPDGQLLAVSELHEKTSLDVVIGRVEGSDERGYSFVELTRLAATPAAEVEPVFSPDGKWIAYSSNESGRFEVYVRPFPGSGGVRQVSRNGGGWPNWLRSRSELLFSTLDQRLMSATYSIDGNAFRSQPPREWSTVRFQMLGPVVTRSFALHPDDKRVALARALQPGASSVDKAVFVFNLFDELRRVAPPR